MRIAALCLALLASGCATKPISKKKQDQVDLANQTGIYSYQRALGGPPR
jgi:hypothetical protein